MPYTFTHTNGQTLVTVPDQTIDKATIGRISLIGRNAVNYGQDLTENFIYMLENFSAPVPPTNPIIGQLWYDSSVEYLRLWDGRQWKLVGNDEGTPFNVPNTLVKRDAQGGFEATLITANLNGSSLTASKWTFPRVMAFNGDAVGSASFDGSHDFIVPIEIMRARHADTATLATNTLRSQEADHALEADHARESDHAREADHAKIADDASKLRTPRGISISQDGTASGGFDGTADLNLALTLATVNPNVGSFGSNNVLPRITVNAKGLVTAVSTLPIVKVPDSDHADRADLAARALSADRTASADRAALADRALIADTTSEATHAQRADSADNATKLRTPRTISIVGKVQGSAAFDGSANVTIATTGGDSTDAQNIGSGGGQVFYDKSGDTLRFRSINAGTGITVTQSDGNIVIGTSGGGTSTALAVAANFDRGGGVTVSNPGSANGQDMPLVSQVLQTWEINAAGYASVFITATQNGGAGMNGLRGGGFFATARVEIYVDGVLKRTASNSIAQTGVEQLAGSPATASYAGSAGNGGITVRFIGDLRSSYAKSYAFANSTGDGLMFK